MSALRDEDEEERASEWDTPTKLKLVREHVKVWAANEMAQSADTLALTPERASVHRGQPLTNCAALPILYLLCQTSIRVNTGFTSSPNSE